jgi:hypothetical protein
LEAGGDATDGEMDQAEKLRALRVFGGQRAETAQEQDLELR